MKCLLLSVNTVALDINNSKIIIINPSDAQCYQWHKIMLLFQKTGQNMCTLSMLVV